MSASWGLSPEFKDQVEDLALKPEGRSVVGRALQSRHTLHIPDISTDPDYPSYDPRWLGGYHAILGVPLMREGMPIGVMMVGRTTPAAFTEAQIALVTTFADQAVIAIENVRLFDEVQARTEELRRSLQQQTATANVLEVISRSAFDLKSVFETVAESAVRLCEADRAFIYRFDGELLRMAVALNAPQALKDFLEQNPLAPGRQNGATRAALERRSIHIPDAQADPEYTFGNALLDPISTVLAVPMLKGNDLLGVIAIYRLEVRPFDDEQIALVETFADQAVIAIDNVRLFEAEQARTEELSESLQQQTATAEVLKVISRSTFDLQAVLDTLVELATGLCDADHSWLFQREGDFFHWVASFGNATDAHTRIRNYFKTRPVPLGRGSITGRAALEARVIYVPDVLADPEYTWSEAQKIGGYRAALGVPLLRKGSVVGVLFIAKTVPQPFTAKQIELVTTFADQAGIAIENTRLLNELRELLEQQTATSEVLRVISSSPGTLEPIFDAMLTNAIRICEARFGNFLLYENGGFRHVKLHGAPSAYAEAMQREPVLHPRPGHNLDRVAKTKRLVHVPDVMAQPPDTQGRLGPLAGARTLLIVPMLKDDELIGAIGIYRQEVRPFTDKQIELVQNFAAQAVIAIENTRLLNGLRELLQQQTATADVLKVISRSTFDLQTVLQTLVELAARCVTPTRVRSRDKKMASSFARRHTASRQNLSNTSGQYPSCPDEGPRPIALCSRAELSISPTFELIQSTPLSRRKDWAISAQF